MKCLPNITDSLVWEEILECLSKLPYSREGHTLILRLFQQYNKDYWERVEHKSSTMLSILSTMDQENLNKMFTSIRYIKIKYFKHEMLP